MASQLPVFPLEGQVAGGHVVRSSPTSRGAPRVGLASHGGFALLVIIRVWTEGVAPAAETRGSFSPDAAHRAGSGGRLFLRVSRFKRRTHSTGSRQRFLSHPPEAELVADTFLHVQSAGGRNAAVRACEVASSPCCEPESRGTPRSARALCFQETAARLGPHDLHAGHQSATGHSRWGGEASGACFPRSQSSCDRGHLGWWMREGVELSSSACRSPPADPSLSLPG
nr:uncharacterized protein LOC118973474 [Manis javanica]